jgi:hypothetical protein
VAQGAAVVQAGPVVRRLRVHPDHRPQRRSSQPARQRRIGGAGQSHVELYLRSGSQPLGPDLRTFDARIIGISVDGIWSHQEFGRVLGLDYPLVSD